MTDTTRASCYDAHVLRAKPGSSPREIALSFAEAEVQRDREEAAKGFDNELQAAIEDVTDLADSAPSEACRVVIREFHRRTKTIDLLRATVARMKTALSLRGEQLAHEIEVREQRIAQVEATVARLEAEVGRLRTVVEGGTVLATCEGLGFNCDGTPEEMQPSEPAKWTKVTNFDGEEELHSNPGGPVWDAAKASDKHACSKCGHGDHEDMCHILCDTCKANSEPAGEVTTENLNRVQAYAMDMTRKEAFAIAGGAWCYKYKAIKAGVDDINANIARATAADKATIAELRAELERTKKWRDDCEESMCQLAEEKVEVESERDAARAELERVKADLDRATDEGIEAERRLSDVADALHCKALIDVMIATARDMREKHDRRWMLLRRLCLAAQHDHDDGRTQDKLRRIFDQMFIQELAAELATDHEQPAAADGEK